MGDMADFYLDTCNSPFYSEWEEYPDEYHSQSVTCGICGAWDLHWEYISRTDKWILCQSNGEKHVHMKVNNFLADDIDEGEL